MAKGKRADHQGAVSAIYDKTYRTMGLPPRILGGLKEAMLAASKESGGDKKSIKVAAKTFLKEKGYKKGKKVKAGRAKREPAEEKEEKKGKKKRSKKSSGDESKAEAVLKKHAPNALKGDPDNGVPKGNIDVTKLDRRTLKGMAVDLGVGYKKKWDDDELRSKVAAAMVGMDEEVAKHIQAIDPTKLASVKDCVGLLIDLTKGVCIACPLQSQCRELMEEHRADGFDIFKKLRKGKDHIEQYNKKEEKEGSSDSGAIEVNTSVNSKKLPDVKVKVDGEKVAIAGEAHDAYRKSIKAVKKAQPKTLKEMMKIVHRFNPPDENTKAAKKTLRLFVVSYFTAIGLIKLM